MMIMMMEVIDNDDDSADDYLDCHRMLNQDTEKSCVCVTHSNLIMKLCKKYAEFRGRQNSSHKVLVTSQS